MKPQFTECVLIYIYIHIWDLSVATFHYQRVSSLGAVGPNNPINTPKKLAAEPPKTRKKTRLCRARGRYREKENEDGETEVKM